MANAPSAVKIERFDETVLLSAGSVDVTTSSTLLSDELTRPAETEGLAVVHVGLGPMFVSLSSSDALAIGDALIRAGQHYRAQKAKALAQQVAA